jgi:hypothetical protein
MASGPWTATSPTTSGAGEAHWDDTNVDYGVLVSFHVPPVSDADQGRVEASMDGMTGKVRWHIFGGPATTSVGIEFWVN